MTAAEADLRAPAAPPREAAGLRTRALQSAWRLLLGPMELGSQVISRPWRVAAPAEAELHVAITDDGWRLPLYRLRGPRAPVLLQHGLGASHRAWCFPGRSLAAALHARGFDVWLSDLRGRLGARPPHRRARDWSVDDYLDRDIPAFHRTIRAASRVDELAMVGHSMGGVLTYMFGIRHGTEGLRCAVTSAASLDYAAGDSDHRRFLPLRPLIATLPYVPYGSFSRWMTPALGRVRNPIELFSYHPDNLEGHLARRWYASVFQNIAPGVLLSLATTFEDGGFRAADGFRYNDHLDRFQAPLLAIGGADDRQVSPQAVESTAQAVGSPSKKVRIFGRDRGDAAPYGHADLLVGRAAPEEVWPELIAWLEAHTD